MEKFFRAEGEELQTLLTNEGFRKMEGGGYLDADGNEWDPTEMGGGLLLECDDVVEE